MVVSDDDGPDFVDELEAELAARRPVPVQQDEPEGTCRLCAGEGWFGWEGVKVPGQRLLAQRKAHCKLCDGTGVERPVPVQQDEPEGVCAFPNCSCTENRCPAKGERGPFCDHGFHPRLCGRCAPVPEAVTDEDEVQCQMCKTVQPRPDKECGHCGAGPKYLCPIHTRPAAVPVQQEPEDERMDTLLAEMGHERWVDAWREAADWRDQYRAGRDEVTGLLRAVVSEIDPMELTEMYAYLEADAYLATLDVLADSESNAAGGSEKGAPSVLKHHACRTCGSLLIDCECPPSSEGVAGLRDRIKEAADLALDFTADELETLADALMSVLLEAGTFEQPDMVVELTGFTLTPEQREFVKRAEATFTVTDEVPPAEAGTQEDEQDSFSALTSDTGLIREVARANVELIDLSEKINAAVERWTAEAKRRKEDLTTAPAEAGTQEDGLDALARQFKNGQTVVWGDGPTQQGAVVGFGYTIPERPGGPDRPALVVRERWGERTGHVLPSELDAHAAVSGTPDTKEDAL